jgi:hypothetical protein
MSKHIIIIMEDVVSLKQEINELRSKVSELEEKLKKYTAPTRSKKYYENHKEELLEKMKKYKPSPERLKETNRKAYLKRKEKLEKEKLEQADLLMV